MIDRLIEASKRAGEVLLSFKGRLKKVETKGSISDLVSEADIESQKTVYKILEDLDVRFVGEEDYSGDPSVLNRGKVVLVDPLDGTLNYVHGYNFYSISIALLENGEITMGVVHLPELDETFHAVRGEGAFLNGERISVSNVDDLSGSLVVTGWPYDEEGTRKTAALVSRIVEHVQEIRILGSCAAELSYIAAGRIDGYFEFGLGPWDLAAGYLIAKEAGAVVSSISEDEFDLTLGEVVAGNPTIHGKLLELVREGLM